MDELPLLKVQERTFRDLAYELYNLVRDSFFALKDRHEVDVTFFYRVDKFFPTEADYQLLQMIYNYVAATYRNLVCSKPPLPFEGNHPLCAEYRQESWKLYYMTEARALTSETSFTRAVLDLLMEHNSTVKKAALDKLVSFLEQRYAYLRDTNSS